MVEINIHITNNQYDFSIEASPYMSLETIELLLLYFDLSLVMEQNNTKSYQISSDIMFLYLPFA